MMLRSQYDYIVLGATIPGVLFAAAKARAGYSVLLTNRYGFPGGSVTELLNCFQEIPSNTDAEIAELCRIISRDTVAPSVVNPETVKYALQMFLETTNVDLYYHVVPHSMSTDDPSSVSISFLAKEGLVTVSGKKVLDASDELYGAAIVGIPTKVEEQNINIFITAPNNESFLSFPKVRHSVKLNDGRYWISLRIDSTNELFQEDESHMLMDEFRIVLERSGSRIQMLPLGIHSQISLHNGNALNGSFVTLNDLLGRTFKPSAQFAKTSAVLETINIF